MIALDEPHDNGSRELCRIAQASQQDRVLGLHVSNLLENGGILVFTAESQFIVTVNPHKIGTDGPPISAAIPIRFL